jgi:hypothetical protein
MPRKQSDTVQLKLRFPERVRNRIEAAAERNQRSMNAEIVARLEQSFERDDRAALIEATAHATANAIVQGLRFTPRKPTPYLLESRPGPQEKTIPPKASKKDEQ